jgi:hypothetical protein
MGDNFREQAFEIMSGTGTKRTIDRNTPSDRTVFSPIPGIDFRQAERGRAEFNRRVAAEVPEEDQAQIFAAHKFLLQHGNKHENARDRFFAQQAHIAQLKQDAPTRALEKKQKDKEEKNARETRRPLSDAEIARMIAEVDGPKKQPHKKNPHTQGAPVKPGNKHSSPGAAAAAAAAAEDPAEQPNPSAVKPR